MRHPVGPAVSTPLTAPVASRPPGRRGSRRPLGPATAPGGVVSTAAPAVLVPVARVTGETEPRATEDRAAPSPAENGHGTRPDRRPLPTSQAGRWAARQRRTLLLTIVLGAGIGGLFAGPVAAAALAGYGALGARALLRRATAGRAARDRRERLDQLCALAADLRAGLPVAVAAQVLSSPAARIAPELGWRVPIGEAAAETDRPGGADQEGMGGMSPGDASRPDRPGRLAHAAIRLADRTGAPLAELVERIEADARSTDRGLAAAAAQAAGARATAWLLAALPLGGIGLGYGIGVDPLQVLLYTPIGGGCAIVAVGLQVIGLLWADRLAVSPSGGS
ncbi:hypothetical protein [Micromonospora sp. WMMD1082]|uniref:type II secretion system F family protein n=1 Tax=Micromonospora sp. WMMD1082 TaxID=3016104 RepID=UPI002416272C|nr:hypothetical protein [Micromonospora sp. WMMD1082]MDG4795353.1 hypothetical protein [Micromonospora sp. WMMD1082]